MRPLLKYCGNHSLHDVKLSLSSEADFIGFVFAKSKRQVTRDQVKSWLENVRIDEQKKLVALFVNASADEVVQTIDGLPFSVVQCHGNEPPEVVAEIKKRTNLSVWKVIHHSDDAIHSMKTYAQIADGYIIDCKVGNQWGGTGVSFDWRFVPSYLEEGRRQGVCVFIAGGITPDNVRQLLPYNPDGIDLSSGIEENGQKSKKRMLQLEERMNKHDNELSR